MQYRHCGNSGIKLHVLSLGLWHNFGDVDNFNIAKDMVVTAFDNGICHFDLANNYDPPPGNAEADFCKVLKKELYNHRYELFISDKAGHDMWCGVYGTGSSGKNRIASCNQSLKRTGLDSFDVFYSHRYDPDTQLEETMQALIDLVHQWKTLYVGISKYLIVQQQEAYNILKEANVPCVLSQYRCSMFDQKARHSNFSCAESNVSGIICFSPLAQGLLTRKYNNGIPSNSRAAKSYGFLQVSQITIEIIKTAKKLAYIAEKRNKTLSQMALAETDFADDELSGIKKFIKSPTLS